MKENSERLKRLTAEEIERLVILKDKRFCTIQLSGAAIALLSTHGITLEMILTRLVWFCHWYCLGAELILTS